MRVAAEGVAAEGRVPQARSPWQRVLACLAVAVVIAALVCLVQTPKYAMPDDFMQDLYARGAYFDTSGYLMLYSLVPFSAPVSGLYALLPGVPWFPGVMLAMVAASFAALGDLVLGSFSPRSLKVFLVCALALAEAMVCAYFTYTVVAFVATAAGVALVLRRACFTRPEGRVRASDAFAYLMIIEGFSLRPESGVAALGLFAPFLVWALAKNRNARTLLMAAGVVAAMGLSQVAGLVAWHTAPGWESFEQTFHAAQAVADYPRVAAEDAARVAPELSENDVDMIYDFLFVDADTYSLETFQALDTVVHGYGLGTMLSGITQRLSFTAFAFGLDLILFATAGLIGAARRLRGGALALAFSIPVLATAEILMIFLRARLKMHVLLPIFVVGLMALAVCCLLPAGRAAAGSSSPRRRVLVGRVLPIAGVAAFAAVFLALEMAYVRPLQRSLGTPLTQATQSYVAEHPDDLVLFTLTQGALMNDDVFAFERWQQPENAVFIGGYEYYTAPWRTFLARAGLSRDGFLRNLVDDPGMVTVSYAYQAEMIARYLSEHTGAPVRAERLDTLGQTAAGEDVAVWAYTAGGADA